MRCRSSAPHPGHRAFCLGFSPCPCGRNRGKLPSQHGQTTPDEARSVAVGISVCPPERPVYTPALPEGYDVIATASRLRTGRSHGPGVPTTGCFPALLLPQRLTGAAAAAASSRLSFLAAKIAAQGIQHYTSNDHHMSRPCLLSARISTWGSFFGGIPAFEGRVGRPRGWSGFFPTRGWWFGEGMAE